MHEFSNHIRMCKFCELLQQIYKDFGFAELKVKFSDRPSIRAGDDTTWDKAEKHL